MNVIVGVASRQGPQQNPLMKRLMESLQKHRPGVNMAVQIEVGEQYTRGEKRQRIFTLAKAHGVKHVCVAGDSKVRTLHGDVPIRELAGQRDFWVYAYESGRLVLRKARCAKLTRKNADVVRVRFSWAAGTGRGKGVVRRESEIVCTPDHRFVLKSGEQCAAGELRPGDQLQPMYRRRGKDGWYVALGGSRLMKESRFVFEQTRRCRLAEPDKIHHIDGNPYNNDPANLERHTASTHAGRHWADPQRWHRQSEKLRSFYQDGKPAQAEINRRSWAQMSLSQQARKLKRMQAGLRQAAKIGVLSARSLRGWATRRLNGTDHPSPESNVKRQASMLEQYASGRRTPPSTCSEVAAKISRVKRLRFQQALQAHQLSANHTVVSVEPVGREDVFCLDVPGARTFVANELVVRNCILEDDTEVLEDDWLVRLLQPMLFGDVLGMVNPMESKDGLTPCAPQLKGQVLEAAQCYGFCILFDLSWEPRYDPRITWLDDLAMSLQCRAAGRRVVMAGVTMIRHSKEPFLRDDQPPWVQQDRSRWGSDSSYYNQNAFDAERRAEAALLVQQYGDMARMSLPPELLLNQVPTGASSFVQMESSPRRSEVDRLIEEYQGPSDPG